MNHFDEKKTLYYDVAKINQYMTMLFIQNISLCGGLSYYSELNDKH